MSPSRKKPVAAPVYAAVGAADLAVEQLKKTLAQVEALADQVRKDLEDRVAKAGADAQEAAARAGRAAHDAPEQALNQGLTVAGLASHAYDEMARRGRRVVGQGVQDIREDRRVKEAAARAGSTVKVATETAATVMGYADKAMDRKDSAAVTVKGTVVEGEQPETAPAKNVRAAAAAAAAGKDKDTPATPRRRTTRRATTVKDVTPDDVAEATATSGTSSTGSPKASPKPASRRPSRASVTTKAAVGEADPVAASSGNAAATETAPATGTTTSAPVQASVDEAAQA